MQGFVRSDSVCSFDSKNPTIRHGPFIRQRKNEKITVGAVRFRPKNGEDRIYMRENVDPGESWERYARSIYAVWCVNITIFRVCIYISTATEEKPCSNKTRIPYEDVKTKVDIFVVVAVAVLIFNLIATFQSVVASLKILFFFQDCKGDWKLKLSPLTPCPSRTPPTPGPPSSRHDPAGAPHCPRDRSILSTEYYVVIPVTWYVIPGTE